MPGMSMSLGMGLTRNQGGALPAPIGLGAAWWWDPSDLSTMRQDRGGAAATVAAAVDSPVGSWLAKGSTGGWLSSISDAGRPILRSSAGKYWLDFDGVDDFLTGAVGTWIASAFTVVVGARPTNFTGSYRGMLSQAPASGGGGAGFGGAVASGRLFLGRAGVSDSQSGLLAFSAATNGVASWRSTSGINAGSLTVTPRLNGAEDTNLVVAGYSGTLDRTVIGGASASAASNSEIGRVYDRIIFQKVLSASELALIEAYITARLA